MPDEFPESPRHKIERSKSPRKQAEPSRSCWFVRPWHQKFASRKHILRSRLHRRDIMRPAAKTCRISFTASSFAGWSSSLVVHASDHSAVERRTCLYTGATPCVTHVNHRPISKTLCAIPVAKDPQANFRRIIGQKLKGLHGLLLRVWVIG